MNFLVELLLLCGLGAIIGVLATKLFFRFVSAWEVEIKNENNDVQDKKDRKVRK